MLSNEIVSGWKMQSSDDLLYDIPSVPKFADLKRMADGESANDSNVTIGDGFFDVSGIVAGSILNNNKVRAGSKQTEAECFVNENKENELSLKQTIDDSDDDSLFGIKKMAMFRQSQQNRRGVSTERLNTGDTQASLAKPRSISCDNKLKRRSDMPTVNNRDGNKRPQIERRSIPVALYKKAINNNRAANKPNIQQRLNMANPAAYKGPETRQRAKIDKQAIISASVIPSSVRSADSSAANKKQILTTNKTTTNKADDNKNDKPKNIVRREHIPRERTRRPQKTDTGPVRLQKTSITSAPKNLPAVQTERRFRESVTRRQRGGESMERDITHDATPVKSATKPAAANQSSKRRSGFLVGSHPSTRGLRNDVVRVRSNPNSRPGSRAQSADGLAEKLNQIHVNN
ncbi:unnamed protein product [Anisakis simplex]|uniref:Shugoshin_C domain-containing protein n=1 Tax=Anisakis simplex TaxID=6269 RepID=A0A0M3JYK2_ANISI|nr:unnamed protein product [Anisakis simplex]